jgi:hypothetical protein
MERRTSRLIRPSTLATAAVLGAVAPSAATAQSEVLYEGRTSQDRPIRLAATPEGQVKRVWLRWKVRCRRQGTMTGRGYFDTSIEQQGNQFTGGATHRLPRQDGMRPILTTRIEGTIEPGSGAQGIARFVLRFRRNGRQVDYCRSGTVRWSVARAG